MEPVAAMDDSKRQSGARAGLHQAGRGPRSRRDGRPDWRVTRAMPALVRGEGRVPSFRFFCEGAGSAFGRCARRAATALRGRSTPTASVGSRADVRRNDAPGIPRTSPRPRVAHASGRVVTGDRSTEGEYDEGDGRVAEHLHIHLLLLKLRDLDDAGPVRFEISRLVISCPSGPTASSCGCSSRSSSATSPASMAACNARSSTSTACSCAPSLMRSTVSATRECRDSDSTGLEVSDERDVVVVDVGIAPGPWRRSPATSPTPEGTSSWGTQPSAAG
jgi:hypothetical protein